VRQTSDATISTQSIAVGIASKPAATANTHETMVAVTL
jgi:hypothetical protein